MLKPVLLVLICLVLLGLSIRLFYRGLRQAGTQRVLGRLSQGKFNGRWKKPPGRDWSGPFCEQVWGGQPTD